MFGVAKLFSSFDDIKHGNTAKTNLKLMDLLPLQHMHLPDGVNVLNKISLAQTFCTPFANCNSNNPSNGRYIATCSNYPDFAVSWKDSKNVTSYLVGMKVRVRFQYGITYGSVSAGTYPYLNINSSGAFPMLAQGKPMATGAISAGQTVELTLIPYGSSYAWDADSNVRESTDDYVIYTDGTTEYSSTYLESNYGKRYHVTSGKLTLPFVTRRNYLVLGFISNGGGTICTVISMWNYNSSVYKKDFGADVTITRDGTNIVLSTSYNDYEINVILV